MKKTQLIFAWVIMLASIQQVLGSEGSGFRIKSFEALSSTRDNDDKRSGSGAAHKGMIILQPDFNVGGHAGFGRYGYHYYDQGIFLPGFTFNVDFGVHDYVSLGPYIGFGGGNGFTQLAIGGRVVFHWWQLLDDKVAKDLKSDKIDFYLPVHFGVAMTRKNTAKDDLWRAGGNGGGGLGFRYYFVKRFGVNLEWGWQEMSWAKIGLTVNLN